MGSFVGWIDYTEKDKQKALEFIQRFQEKNTVDELGLGVIRDAFADLLFPGTSTLHTRARYFLFIPWIYLKLEEKGISSAEIAQKARQEEIRLIKALLEGPSKDEDGIIGKSAKERLKNLPSTLYWQGLSVWGMRRFSGSQDQYHRYLDSFYKFKNNRIKYNEDGELLEGKTLGNWNPGLLPLIPDKFPKQATVDLTKEEASFIRDSFVQRNPSSLLAHLMITGKVAVSDYPWLHPEFSGFPEINKRQLEHARNFAVSLHGAAILYNLILTRMDENRKAEVETYRQMMLEDWAIEMKNISSELSKWNREAFWRIVKVDGQGNVSSRTERFVEEWLDIALGDSPEKIIENKTAINLIIQRECQIKGSQARVRNQRALERWGGASGIRLYSFRWNPEVMMLHGDIATALAGTKNRA